jgi:tRNA threonylcarbamoyl adenosine modification protein (Sua5/YciO/YrdC/YwlC family)
MGRGVSVPPGDIVSLKSDRQEAIARAVLELSSGRLVVAPTDTIYGLLGDAFNAYATTMAFEAKARPRSLPLPVLVCTPRQAWALCSKVPPEAGALAKRFWPGALTLVLPAADLGWDLGDATGSVALRIPGHDDLLEIIRAVGPLAGTSANITGEPTPRTARGVAKVFGSKVSLYLDGGTSRADRPSTIVDLTGDELRVTREGAISSGDIAQAATAGPTSSRPS